MPKYILKIFRNILAGITLRDLELLAAWMKNTDSSQAWYSIISGLESEINDRKGNQ
jgi:hypothetical protein